MTFTTRSNEKWEILEPIVCCLQHHLLSTEGTDFFRAENSTYIACSYVSRSLAVSVSR